MALIRSLLSDGENWLCGRALSCHRRRTPSSGGVTRGVEEKYEPNPRLDCREKRK